MVPHTLLDVALYLTTTTICSCKHLGDSVMIDDTEKLVNLSKAISSLSEAYSMIKKSERSQNGNETNIDKLLSEVILKTTAFIETLPLRDRSYIKQK